MTLVFKALCLELKESWLDVRLLSAVCCLLSAVCCLLFVTLGLAFHNFAQHSAY
jgi:hypothetical protein